jgi:hypothetical protein
MEIEVAGRKYRESELRRIEGKYLDFSPTNNGREKRRRSKSTAFFISRL